MGCIANAVVIFIFIVALIFFFNISSKSRIVEGANADIDSGTIHIKEVTSGNVINANNARKLQGIFPGEFSTDGKVFSLVSGDGGSLKDEPVRKFVIYPDDEIAHSPRLTRFKRFPQSCNDTLQAVKNAVITCWAWPSFLTCEINCSHGHVMKENGKIQKSTIRKCREPKPKWYPIQYFPSCQPFIHCDVILNAPGRVKCESKPPQPRYCDISCSPYEDHDEVPERRYECLDDKFGATLPFCVSLSKNEMLLPPPPH